MTTANSDVWYTGKLLRVNPKSSSYEENIYFLYLFFFLYFVLHLYEKTDISWTYCGDYTIYVNQTLILYTLSLYSDVCPLFLNKTAKNIFKKEVIFSVTEAQQ